MSNESGAVAVERFSRAEERGGAVIQAGATSLLAAITQVASNPQADIEKMERLFAMHQKMVAQEAEAAFNAAMARAQANIVPVVNNAENSQTNSRYAKLAAINKAITPIYTAEGLSISFGTGDAKTAGDIRIIAIVSHAQGHSRQYHIDLPLDNVGTKGTVNKTGVQATGSTNAYGRRYLVLMIFNVSTEDDNDGQPEPDGMTDGQRADFAAAIDALETKDAAAALWKTIVAECHKTGDKAAYSFLKDAIAAKGKVLK